MHAGGLGHKPEKKQKNPTFRISSVPRWDDLYPEVLLLSAWKKTKCWIYTRHICFSLPAKRFAWNWNIDIKAPRRNKAHMVKYLNVMTDGEPRKSKKLKSQRREGAGSVWNVAACIVSQRRHRGATECSRIKEHVHDELSQSSESSLPHVALSLLLYRDPQRARKLFFYKSHTIVDKDPRLFPIQDAGF